jgi:hypothetical protein
MDAATTAAAAETQAESAEDGSDLAPNGGKSDASENGDERDESGCYLSREAASYRRRLRETEAERDDLRGRLDRSERAEVERLAGDAGLRPTYTRDVLEPYDWMPQGWGVDA